MELLLPLLLLISSCGLAAAQQPPRQMFTVDLAAGNLQQFDNAAVTRCFGSSHGVTSQAILISIVYFCWSSVVFPCIFG